MPGFRLEVQGDATGVEVTVLYKTGTPLSEARADLTRVYIKAMEELIKRLESPEDAEKHIELMKGTDIHGSL